MLVLTDADILEVVLQYVEKPHHLEQAVENTQLRRRRPGEGSGRFFGRRVKPIDSWQAGRLARRSGLEARPSRRGQAGREPGHRRLRTTRTPRPRWHARP